MKPLYKISYNLSVELLVKDKLYYYVTYLKLQNFCSKWGGKFRLNDLKGVTNLSLKSAKNHIKNLLQLGLIKQLDKDYFNIISYKKLESLKKKVCVKVNKSYIDKLSYKNLTKFKALIMTFIDKKFEQYKKKLCKGYSVLDLKDRSRKVIKDGGIKGFYGLIACSISAFKCNKSVSTISRWRKKQKVAKYQSNKYLVNIEGLSNLSSSEINLINPLNKTCGTYFKSKNKVYYSEVSSFIEVRPIRFSLFK